MIIYYLGNFTIGPTGMTFDEAEAYCNNLGSNLATIKDINDRDEAKAFCQTLDHSNSNGCWIGLYFEDASWKWTDQSDLGQYGFDLNGNPTTGIDPWHYGEPKNWNSHGDACIHFFKRQYFNWNDGKCSDGNYPICNSNDTIESF